MKGTEIRDLSVQEITQRREQLQEELFRLRFRAATATLENPMLLRSLRRDIARLNTILTEQQRKEASR